MRQRARNRKGRDSEAPALLLDVEEA